jgi:uncharacterized protein DUF6941
MAFPKIDACLVCEAVRPEAAGKHILLGFYGTTPHVRVALRDANLPAVLCFVFCGGAGEGTFRIDMTVTNSDGTQIASPIATTLMGTLQKEKVSTTVFMTFNGTFGAYGKYEVTLLVDGKKHYSTPVYIDPMQPSGLSPIVQ